MPAYAIFDVSIHDQETYEQYKKLTPAAIAAYQGEFVARGGKVLPMEGNWIPERLVIVRFPSVEMAESWWNSPEYSEARAIRQQSANTRMVIVEGN